MSVIFTPPARLDKSPNSVVFEPVHRRCSHLLRLQTCLGMFRNPDCLHGLLKPTTAGKESKGGFHRRPVHGRLTFTLTSFTCTFAFPPGGCWSPPRTETGLWPVLGLLAFPRLPFFTLPFFLFSPLFFFQASSRSCRKAGGWNETSPRSSWGLIEAGRRIQIFLGTAGPDD